MLGMRLLELSMTECIHGEPKGSQACPLCRYALRLEAPTAYVSPSHPQTSQNAVKKARAASGSRRKLVFDLIKRHREMGLCDHEIIDLTGLSPNTARPTRVTLMKDGFVVNSGRTRKTPEGNDAIVWIADMFVPRVSVAQGSEGASGKS
jgi:hypothetical protein